MTVNQNGKENLTETFIAPLPMTILLVDDTAATRSITKLFLNTFGYVVHPFPNAEDALASFDPRLHDVVVTDNTMPGMTGMELAHIVKMRSPATPVVMYTGNRPANCSGLDTVIEKPAPLTVLKEVVDKLFALRR